MTDPKRSRPPDPLPTEHQLAGIYADTGAEMPPEALDKKILAAAHRAARQGAAQKPFLLRWAAPLSTAAIVVLAIGTTLLMTRQGALDHRAEIAVPSEYDLAPASPPASEVPRGEARDIATPSRPAAIAESAAPAKRAAAKEEALVKSIPEAKMKSAPAAAPALADRAGASREAERSRNRTIDRRATLATAGVATMSNQGANVTAVQVSGSPGGYSFNVTVRSPDTGCQQFADWWEVLGEDGKLLYRRVLLHSHVGEQPFTRSGGPVPIQSETVVWVRAHMNTSGFGGGAMKGSVQAGFKPTVLDASFAASVAKQPPLPDGCAF